MKQLTLAFKDAKQKKRNQPEEEPKPQDTETDMVTSEPPCEEKPKRLRKILESPPEPDTVTEHSTTPQPPAITPTATTEATISTTTTTTISTTTTEPSTSKPAAAAAAAAAAATTTKVTTAKPAAATKSATTKPATKAATPKPTKSAPASKAPAKPTNYDNDNDNDNDDDDDKDDDDLVDKKNINSEAEIKKHSSDEEDDDDLDDDDDDDDKPKDTATSATNSIKAKATKKATSSSSSASKKSIPNPSSYNPEAHITWGKGSPVPYAFLAEAFDKIEATTKRLEITQILCNAFRTIIASTPEDLLPAVCLASNQIAPAFEGVELGVGEGVLLKTIAQATGQQVKRLRDKLREAQDLGVIARNSRATQKTMFQPRALTIRKVLAEFIAIAKCSGKESQTQKQEKIKLLLVASRGNEAQYIVRALMGSLRIGLQHQTTAVALAHAVIATPPITAPNPDVELIDAAKARGKDIFETGVEMLHQALSECPSYEAIVPALLSRGVGALPSNCSLTVGVPVKPMLAKPTKGISIVLDRMENSAFTCEYKYDGERAQIHMLPEGKVLIYSRNLENNTTKYPDIISSIHLCLGPDDNHRDLVKSCILDCEVVAVDTETFEILPFQTLSTRARKGVSLDQVKIAVSLYVFDLLYLNGQPLIHKTLRERRQVLKESFHVVPGKFQFAESIDSVETSEIEEFLQKAIVSKCEGLMVKTLDDNAVYQPSRRSLNWLKLKKDYLDGCADSFDLVPIGAWYGKGKRTGTFGAYLLACYNPDDEEFQTICKVGTGFTDASLTQLHEALSQHVITIPPAYYRYSDTHTPHVWLSAAQVWEIHAADLSISPAHKAALGMVDAAKGIALRFPRFIRIREDKNCEDATTAEQVVEMFRAQGSVWQGGNGDDDNDL